MGVIAYNEEKNIGPLLEGLIKQETKCCTIREILVVSSGSTDKTNDIVRGLNEDRVRLIVQESRDGKAAAVNLFIKESTSDLLVLSSADFLVEENTIEELVKPFIDPKVSMSGVHPLPVNTKDSLFGFLVNLSWHIHHLGNMKNSSRPKLGEMVAFRKLFNSIPEETAVDEAEIQSILESLTTRQVYCPNARIHNKGPCNLNDYVKQRLRINIGHMELEKRTGYCIPGPFFFDKIKWGFKYIGFSPKKLALALFGSILEHSIKILAYIQLNLFNKNPYIWDMVESTKFTIVG